MIAGVITLSRSRLVKSAGLLGTFGRCTVRPKRPSSAASRLYEAQCAVCHGVNGDGKGPRGTEMAGQIWSWGHGRGPGIFTDINYMVQRNGADLANTIEDGSGLMPSFRGKLTAAQVNGLVDYIYTFFYKHPTIP